MRERGGKYERTTKTSASSNPLFELERGHWGERETLIYKRNGCNSPLTANPSLGRPLSLSFRADDRGSAADSRLTIVGYRAPSSKV